MAIIFGVICGLFLAYANGANDNFKGVATLFGSRRLNFRQALTLATIATLAGSFCAIFFSTTLLKAFTGKGIVDASIAASPAFALAVGLAAACTVMLATVLGFPISTTHSLIGALIGVGTIASSSALNWSVLGSKFITPLLASPLLAIAGTVLIYTIFTRMRKHLGITRKTCLCVGNKICMTAPVGLQGEEAMQYFHQNGGLSAAMDDQAACVVRYEGQFLGLSLSRLLDNLHFLSAGAVSFARGLNDAPKIAAILLVGQAINKGNASASILGVTIAMAIGGLLNCRKVADMMSKRVTVMNAGQGLTANLITSFLVIIASRMGLPVSTTHVSCGALFGIGATTGQANSGVIGKILLAWIITLPVAAILGVLFYQIVIQLK